MTRQLVRPVAGLAAALAAVILVATALPAQQSINTFQLKRSDANPVRALVAGPEDADAAILLLHDWFGVTDATRDALQRLAHLGYRVMALDLYDGESATTHERATELSRSLTPDDVRSKLEAGLSALSDAGFESIGTLGFSMGGNPAFNAARMGNVSAAAVVYGGGMENLSDDELAALGFPLLLISGSDDAWPMGTIQALLPRMNAVGADLEVYVYPQARHAYAQPLYAGGDNLDPVATEATWEVLEGFFARNLGE